MSRHLEEDTLLQLAQGELPPGRRGEAQVHIDQCPACRELVAAVVKGLGLTVGEGRRGREFDEVTTETILLRGELPAPGALLSGRFRLLRDLGRGAMGRVFEAEDNLLKVRLAVKLLPPELAGRREFLTHLHDEIRIARKLTHPNICRVHDLGTSDGCHFITMELIEGRTLEALLREGPLPFDRGVALLAQIAAALEVAHAQGVVHRDLKPANIMVDAFDKATVMDFGLARDTSDEPSLRPGPVGTPAYWSPEQARGEQASFASDLYAFGVTAHRVFTGQFPGGPMRTVAGISLAVRALVNQCLDPAPEKRPRAVEVRRRLQQALPGGRFRALPWALGAAAGLLLSAGGVWWALGPARTPGGEAGAAGGAMLLPVAVVPAVQPSSVAGLPDAGRPSEPSRVATDAGLPTLEAPASVKKKASPPKRPGFEIPTFD